MQNLILALGPFGEQGSRGIFTTEVSAQGAFEGPAKQHGRTSVLLLPAIEVAMPIAARAGQVLADLGVAIGHQATCGSSRFSGESSFHRPAGAKPSSLGREMPFKTTLPILTTPFKPASWVSSTSS